jgi:hypothetical protein
MREDQAKIVWACFEEALPYLTSPCSIREILEELVKGAEGVEKLLVALDERINRAGEQTLRTDLTILRDRIVEGGR